VAFIEIEEARHYLIKNGFETQNASIENIVNAEQKFHISLCGELRYFFEYISGINGIFTDHVFLYGLNGFELAGPYMENKALDQDYSHYFIIGDIDDWCWGYAVDIRSQNRFPVYLVGDSAAPFIEIASSLSEFIKYCVDSDKALVAAE
jgi:hypothetical protein